MEISETIADERTEMQANSDSSGDREAQLLQSMRTLVEQMEPASKGIDDATLKRFLLARGLNVNKSARFFVQHLHWRRSFAPLGYIPDAEIATELERKQVFLQGHDRQGHSIVVLLTARHDAFKRNLEEVKRLFVYTFDKAANSDSCGEEKFSVIGDLGGWGIRNMDIRGYLSVLDILQNQYPERLSKLYLVHLPYLFWKAWKVVYPFIDKVTREKVIFVEDKNLQETFLKDIDRDQLPTIYGGCLELVPVQDCMTPNWPPKTSN